jgi:hypothetical protein
MMSALKTLCSKQGLALSGSWCALTVTGLAYAGSPSTHVEASVFARRIQNGNPEADT